MHLSTVSFFLALASGAVANLHDMAVCVVDREEYYVAPVGGIGTSYSWSKDYTIDTTATECACNYYKARNTGDKQWDKCPDCTFDGTYCNSAGWHIGGDEMNYYCKDLCHAEGSEAN
ncbi:hypothetical protein ASPZODRAFT_162308 [Penicilliopsis zonata CBS 506.65]|uniref:Uncharacterized protein n=1 Tax=Penicilliopsis zonata CBS 506.65 TaxID=1073090 RepID=A0A1L9S4Y9_9EURO|nr:hypothetical protein ASPZODRAFT_162308 [Penicilliopsis zonata CBS 506.65]OJJ42222.1 hypothetical protein ASPZODRAFT_162308 [Penicilliopsis zonata CBS 506.65]